MKRGEEMKVVKLNDMRGSIIVDKAEISKDEKYYTCYIGDVEIKLPMRYIQSITPYGISR